MDITRYGKYGGSTSASSPDSPCSPGEGQGRKAKHINDGTWNIVRGLTGKVRKSEQCFTADTTIEMAIFQK